MSQGARERFRVVRATSIPLDRSDSLPPAAGATEARLASVATTVTAVAQGTRVVQQSGVGCTKPGNRVNPEGRLFDR